MSLAKYFLALTFVFVTFYNAGAVDNEKKEKINAINNYVNFSNECTHGMLIVHRLLENFNKTINKYVDLPDQKINFYSNRDLSEDIFQDVDHYFYTVTPGEWFEIINKNKGKIPASTETKLLASVNQMKLLTSNINNVRFELEDQINTLDLTKRENLGLIYEKLEQAVTWYKSFYTFQKELEKNIEVYYESLNIQPIDLLFPSVIGALQGVYTSNRLALDALYNRDDDSFDRIINSEREALKELRKINLASFNSVKLNNPRFQENWKSIIERASESIDLQNLFMEKESIPEEYKLYDRFYYYYNYAVIGKFNRYSPGMVVDMNNIVRHLDIPLPLFFEIPHYFKVVYPKLLQQAEYIASSDPVISALPRTVKGREVVAADRTIYVDSSVVKFQMYDHKIIDGDIVSISFNGDWIIEKRELTEKPYEFVLKLNDEGKNFLLLHADDMGVRPPATIALSYMYNGKKQLIVLNSNLNQSEIIEVIKE